ncbi:MAG: 3-deoxy-8-phosphooctulonate synthase [Desulfovibrio sp.]|nr:3-deoxy-8-phosphooctulonate synthase [Desulfovibrio sp.]
MQGGFTLEFDGAVWCRFDNAAPLCIIAGPCAIEGRAQTLETAAALKEIFAQAHVPLIFKSSFDKANRTSGASYRGLGMAEGLAILADVRESVGLPVLTDIHLPEQAKPVAQVADMLQIPAFLCRQTDLLLAAAATGKALNIKKGQFLSPWEMEFVAAKVRDVGNQRICLCERGSCFGYNNLVVDMRSLEIMGRTGCPVIFDATHSVQLPGAAGGKSGGQREYVAVLARAAVATGIAGLFMETHPDPDKAPCDGANMLALKSLPTLLQLLCALDHLVKNSPCPTTHTPSDFCGNQRNF